MSAVSGSDAWATRPSGDARPLMMHWDGSTWTRQASPSPSRAGAASINTLNGVNAVSGTDAWAVGFYGRVTGQAGVDKPLTLQWNGTSWTRTPSPSVSTSSGLDSVAALSPTHAWATGSTLPNESLGTTVILHWNGTAWTRS